MPDPDAGSGVPVWSVGGVGAHLAAVHPGYTSLVQPGEEVERDDVLPPGEGTFAERITAMNARSVELFGGGERAKTADFVAERDETFRPRGSAGPSPAPDPGPARPSGRRPSRPRAYRSAARARSVPFRRCHHRRRTRGCTARPSRRPISR